MQAQPGDGLPGIANIIDGDAFVGDDAVVLEEIEGVVGIEPAGGEVVAE